MFHFNRHISQLIYSTTAPKQSELEGDLLPHRHASSREGPGGSPGCFQRLAPRASCPDQRASCEILLLLLLCCCLVHYSIVLEIFTRLCYFNYDLLSLIFSLVMIIFFIYCVIHYFLHQLLCSYSYYILNFVFSITLMTLDTA